MSTKKSAMSEWTVANFKSASSMIRVPCADINLLSGRNNVGKSSLLHALLLQAQTWRANSGDRPLVLNGAFVRLGAYHDLVNDFGGNDGPIKFGVSLDGEDKIRSATSSVSYRRILAQAGISKISMNVSYEKNDLRDAGPAAARIEYFDVRCWSGSKLAWSLNLKSADAATRKFDVQFDDDTRAHIESTYPSFAPNTVFFEAVCPTYIWGAGKKREFLAREVLALLGLSSRSDSYFMVPPLESDEVVIPVMFRRRVLQEAIDSGMVASGALDSLAEALRIPVDGSRARPLKWGALRENFDAVRQMDRSLHILLGMLVDRNEEEWFHFLVEEWSDMEDMQNAWINLPWLRAVRDTFSKTIGSNVKYLGPIRIEPQLVYPLSLADDDMSVGVKGEFTAAVVHHNRSKSVDYYSPEDVQALVDGATPGSPRYATLERAVAVWLRHLGIGTSIRATDLGGAGYRMRVSTTEKGAPRDLVNLGAGVSQILPVIVMGLITDPESILVFEQPELHLHPSAQSKLFDFFYSLALIGKTVIVETHGEHLVNRYRSIRVESDVEGERSPNVSIQFANDVEGELSIREIGVNEFGNFDQWPVGFFDQGYRDAADISRAALAKGVRRDG